MSKDEAEMTGNAPGRAGDGGEAGRDYSRARPLGRRLSVSLE